MGWTGGMGRQRDRRFNDLSVGALPPFLRCEAFQPAFPSPSLLPSFLPAPPALPAVLPLLPIRLRGLEIPEVLHLILLHVPIVFVERLREHVRAIVPAHEIERIRFGRMHRGLERRPSRRRDRPWRQSRIAIRVVRRIDHEIVAPQVAGVGSRLLNRVDDRGVGLKRHPEAKPVHIDRRDQRTLLGFRRLLLDD